MPLAPRSSVLKVNIKSREAAERRQAERSSTIFQSADTEQSGFRPKAARVPLQGEGCRWLGNSKDDIPGKEKDACPVLICKQ